MLSTVPTRNNVRFLPCDENEKYNNPTRPSPCEAAPQELHFLSFSLIFIHFLSFSFIFFDFFVFCHFLSLFFLFFHFFFLLVFCSGGQHPFFCIDCLTISHKSSYVKKHFWDRLGGMHHWALFFSCLFFHFFFIFVFFFNFFPCFSLFSFVFSFHLFFLFFPFVFFLSKNVFYFFILFLFFLSRVLKICGGTPGFLGEKCTF